MSATDWSIAVVGVLCIVGALDMLINGRWS